MCQRWSVLDREAKAMDGSASMWFRVTDRPTVHIRLDNSLSHEASTVARSRGRRERLPSMAGYWNRRQCYGSCRRDPGAAVASDSGAVPVRL